MTGKATATSWMWPHDDGVQGVMLNPRTNRLSWFDNPGCACGDSAQEQTIEDFLKNGALYGSPPEDVVAEMRAALKSLRR
jgi:hypothetical protein